MSVTSLGVGSGIDLESLVENMISIQRDSKVSAYEAKISDYNSEVSAYGAIKSALETFETAVETLADSDLFTGRSASVAQSEGEEVISVEADSDASNGTYNIAVLQLAQGSRSVSSEGLFGSSEDEVSSVGGDLTFSAGGESFTITVSAGATLSELREQINDHEDNFGVSANLVDDGDGNVFLTLNSSVSGEGNDLVVSNTHESLDNVSSVATGAGPAGLNISTNDAARNAVIDVDGIEINSDSNTFENAVSGLTIKAIALSDKDTNGDPETTKTEISFDTDTVKETLESFVSAYNTLLSTFDKYTSTDAILNGSSLVRGLEGNLNSDLMTIFEDAGALNTIFDIGIEMDDDGKLSLDSSSFSDAMEESYDDIVKLFSGETGLATVLEDMLGNYTGSSGLLKDMVDTSQASADKNEESLENFEYRMELYEEQLRSRFTTLDSLLASLNSNGNYLLTQLSSLSSS
ncbi:MAG: flagellar hook protein [Marinomonas sp.]|nr:flagellar hook protein [Marinomonas sp.]